MRNRTSFSGENPGCVCRTYCRHVCLRVRRATMCAMHVVSGHTHSTHRQTGCRQIPCERRHQQDCSSYIACSQRSARRDGYRAAPFAGLAIDQYRSVGQSVISRGSGVTEDVDGQRRAGRVSRLKTVSALPSAKGFYRILGSHQGWVVRRATSG